MARRLTQKSKNSELNSRGLKGDFNIKLSQQVTKLYYRKS